MVEMRVRQHDGIDARRAHRQRLPVPLAQLLESLKQTAVDEHPLAAGLEQVLGAGDGAGGAQECDGQGNYAPKYPVAPVCQNMTVLSAAIVPCRIQAMIPAIAFAVYTGSSTIPSVRATISVASVDAGVGIP